VLLFMGCLVTKEKQKMLGRIATATNNPDNTIFTMEEVERHNKRDDGWMVIYGDVLDISSFVEEHPGGSIIAQYLGKESTSIFEELGHSSDAYEKLNSFKIGRIKERFSQ